MNDHIPVVVRMRVECSRCGHAEDDTYAFDLPFAKAQTIEAYEPGKCPGPVNAFYDIRAAYRGKWLRPEYDAR